MKFLKLLPLLLLCIGYNVFSQDTSNSLENQFVNVIDKSNRYQDYKVVKINKLNELKKSVLDSVSGLESNIENLQKQQANLENSIDSLTLEVKNLNEALVLSKQKEDGISFFGSIIKKSLYNSIMWGIIALLLAGLLVYILRFRRSNNITREAKEKLADTENDFESHRRNALEREQQLRRKLQDEINKQKKS